MGFYINVFEPKELDEMAKLDPTTYEELRPAERLFYDDLKRKGASFVFPEFVRRVLNLAYSLKIDGKTRYDDRFIIWNQNVKVKTLEERGIYPCNKKGFDKLGREDIHYINKYGEDAISHIEPYLTIYCFAPPVAKTTMSRKTSKGEDVPF